MKNPTKSQGLKHSINELTIGWSKMACCRHTVSEGIRSIIPTKKSDRRPDIRTLHLHDKTTHSSRRSTDVNWRQRVAWRTVIVARISIFFKFLLIEKFEYFRQEDEEWVTPRQMNPNPAFEKETKYFHQFIDTWAPGEAPVQTSHYHPTRLSAVFIQKLGGRTGHDSMKGQLIIV